MSAAAMNAPVMAPVELRGEIRRLVIEELNVKSRSPSTIEDDEPLFGGSLGLDSLDALQLAVSIEEKLGVHIPDGPEARVVFQSVRTIAEFVAKVRGRASCAASSPPGEAECARNDH